MLTCFVFAALLLHVVEEEGNIRIDGAARKHGHETVRLCWSYFVTIDTYHYVLTDYTHTIDTICHRFCNIPDKHGK